MRKPFFSLRFRLILLVLLAVLPALGLMLYTGLEQRRLAAADAQEEALRLAQLAANDHERLIEQARQFLAALVQLPAVRDGDTVACSALFADLLKHYPAYTGLTAAEPDGDVFCSATPLAQPVNFADRAWFQRLLQTRDFVVSEYLMGRISGQAVLVLAYPALDTAGQLRAIVTTALALTWLNQLASEAQLPQGSTLTVIDRNGTILARSPDAEKWVGQSVPETSIVEAILARGEGVESAPGLDGIPRLFAFTPLRGSPEDSVYVSIGIPTAVAYADANRALARNLAALALIGALALAAAWFGGNLFILRRVNDLVSTTQRLASGDLSARTGLPYGVGELSQLARTFDHMAEALEQREAERKQAEEALKEYSERLEEMVEERTRALRDAQEQLVRSEKLAVLGQLAGGVSHELRNPLGAVKNAAYFLRMVLQKPEPDVAEMLQILDREVDNCERIISSLLDFAQPRELALRQVHLPEVIEEALARTTVPENVEVLTRYAEALPLIMADPDQLGLVFGNLIRNAIQAMPGGGRLTITAAYVEGGTVRNPQSAIRIQVSDTGVGISEEHMGKIFEPLFTTKAKGMGLGLAVSKTLLERHGGTIEVESQVGKGTTFTVRLPLAS
ncbi:MAG: HAMP domain-containing protein [Chloroflexi bacterium]|nr:HAMP domain-containing protein [Chloroflexota bacterium]